MSQKQGAGIFKLLTSLLTGSAGTASGAPGCPFFLPDKMTVHAFAFRPRGLRGRGNFARLSACCLPSARGHGADTSVWADPYCESFAPGIVATIVATALAGRRSR